MKFGIEKFGIEIFSEGYKSAIRIYQNGKDVSGLYRDEIQYVNQIQDVEVDIAHTYWIDVGDEYVGGYRVIWDSIMKNVYYLPLVTKDSAKGLCDVLEMVAYVNDAMLGYYQDNQIDLVCGDLCKSYRYQSVAESFLDVVLNRVDIPDYYECGGIVFNYDDSTEVIEMFIPIGMLRKKVMASSVFEVSQFVVWYNTMLVECADRFKLG